MTEAEENAQPTKAEPYAWYVLGVLVLVYMLNFIDRQIPSILANDIMRDLGLTKAEMGFLYGTAFGVFYTLFGIPLGRLADNWSRTKLLSIGLALWSGMTALSGFSRNGVQLAGARVGVGIGEATASPSAYSLLSDWFPKEKRATALAIYSSGLYIGGGLSLFIGSQIVGRWEVAYPNGGPFGLAGWQAAFMAVGLPGILLAILLATLREPERGRFDGGARPTTDRPFKAFWDELLNVIPPLTVISAARRGTRPLMVNLAVALGVTLLALLLINLTGNNFAAKLQWTAVGLGIYAVFSWASALRSSDPPAFALIWGTPAFITTALGYGLIAFTSYATSFWAAPYVEASLGATKDEAAIGVGLFGAIAGFLGVILGGRSADALMKRIPTGRLYVLLFGALGPIIPFIIAFTTQDRMTFYIAHFVAGTFTATALGAAAATTQDLVLPRMRGIATATFFVATTLVGLSLGPYLAGYLATKTGSTATAMLSLLAAAPITIGLILFAFRTVPQAERSVRERASAAGEVF